MDSECFSTARDESAGEGPRGWEVGCVCYVRVEDVDVRVCSELKRRSNCRYIDRCTPQALGDFFHPIRDLTTDQCFACDAAEARPR